MGKNKLSWMALLGSLYMAAAFYSGYATSQSAFAANTDSCLSIEDDRSRGYMLMSVKRSVDAEPLTPKLYDMAVLLSAKQSVDQCLEQNQNRPLAPVVNRLEPEQAQWVF